jgi:hypothetical protein
MKYSLVWSLTGDSFDIEPIDYELSQWYAEQSILHKSRYSLTKFQTDTATLNIKQLMSDSDADLDFVNEFLLKFKLPVLNKPNWYDQWEMNELHKQWVVMQKNNPKFDALLFKLNQQAFDAFHRVNRRLHQIESSFRFHLRDINLWRGENPYRTKTFPTGVFNVSICYTDHGRNSMEKFINYDETPNDEELGPWNTLGGSLVINLVKPYERQYPIEFLNYCQAHNLPIQDIFTPFGNLVDCRNNLTEARQIMVRNIDIPDNHISIECM